MVWMQDPLAGLGDLLRGTMHLHGLSHQLNFRLIIDTQLHPISKFLISNPHEYSEYVLQNKNKIINLINSSINSKDLIKNYLMRLEPDSTQMPLMLISNNMEFIPHSESANSLIRKILTPTEEFKAELNSMRAEFNISNNYSILHFRLGDEGLVKRTVNIKKYNDILKLIDTHVTPNDNVLIIADSFAFKQYLCHVRPYLINRIIPTKPVHLSHSTEKDAHMIKETLFDLFLLMNSKSIKTYTIYAWVSGFVHWVSRAFNIPLISINHSNSVFRTPSSSKQKMPMVTLPHASHVINIKPINLKPKMKPQFRLFRFN
jgi:hypothetical protein